MSFTILSDMGINIPITPILLVVIFSILTVISLVHAVILRYHWKNYGNGALELVLVNLIYLVGLAILLCGMALFIVGYSLSS